jgi:very-short-patch-repair endonuclease
MFRELKARPFTLAQARQAGLTLDGLRGRSWRRIGAQLYCWVGLREDPWLVLEAWRRLVPKQAVFSGKTAAWTFGLELDPLRPVEITLPLATPVRARAGLKARRCQVGRSEVRTIRGLRTTTIHRTLRELCATLPAVEALAAIDAAVRRRLTDPSSLCAYAKSNRGQHGVPRLISLAEVAAPAESQMETRLRWLLLEAGLPRPEVQTDLHDFDNRFVGRADLYYPSARLVLEYDGGNHRDRLVADDRRQNMLINAGFKVLRFTASDVHQHAGVVVAQVRGALAAVPEEARFWRQKRAS